MSSDIHTYPDMTGWVFEVFGGKDTRRVLVTHTEGTVLVIRDGMLATIRGDGSFVTSVPVSVLLRACWLSLPDQLAEAAKGPPT